jgi:hypothetical protein
MQKTPTRYGTCQMEGCENPAVIRCQFQSLAGVEKGSRVVRAENEVTFAWCWPCFAVWTLHLRALAPQRIGLGRWRPDAEFATVGDPS